MGRGAGADHRQRCSSRGARDRQVPAPRPGRRPRPRRRCAGARRRVRQRAGGSRTSRSRWRSRTSSGDDELAGGGGIRHRTARAALPGRPRRPLRGRRVRRPASSCSRPSSTWWTAWPATNRSSWHSRTCSGPRRRRSSCSGTSSGTRPKPARCCSSATGSRTSGPATRSRSCSPRPTRRPSVTKLELGALRAARHHRADRRSGPGRARGERRRVRSPDARRERRQPVLRVRAAPPHVATGELEQLVGRGDGGELPIPDSVRDVVGQRLGRLPDGAVTLLSQPAAVIGLTFDLELLAGVVRRRRRGGAPDRRGRGAGRAGARGRSRALLLRPRDRPDHPRRRA